MANDEGVVDRHFSTFVLRHCFVILASGFVISRMDADYENH
jgi:hypothetical protein